MDSILKNICASKTLSYPSTKSCRASRCIWMCLILLFLYVPGFFETLIEKTYEIKETLDGKSCRLDHVEWTSDENSEISCLYLCSRQFNSESVFYNWDTETCKCCAERYTIPNSLPSETGTKYYTTAQDAIVYRDCVEAKDLGVTTSGVQRVRTPITNITIEVYCDMETSGGGWLVFQKRFDGSVDFYRNFLDYEEGFGDVRGEYWLGLQNIYEFTTNDPTMVYLKFVDVSDLTVYQHFAGFYLESGPEYTYRIGDFLSSTDGTSPPSYGNSFATTRGRDFSAADIDRDGDIGMDCANTYQSGWWFNQCTNMNPNGPYVEPGTTGLQNSIIHKTWRGLEALKAIRLMIRRPVTSKK